MVRAGPAFAHSARMPDNGAVFSRLFLALLAIAFLCSAASGPAQYGDRDRTRAHVTSAKAPAAEARTDINHATLEQLVKVPGMTETWARRIIRFRPYRTKDDLLDKGIVSSQVYDRIKDFIIAHKDAQ